MMKTTIMLALVATLALSAAQIQNVEATDFVIHSGNQVVSVSPYISGFEFKTGFINHGDNSVFYGVDSDRVANINDFLQVNWFLTTQGQVEFDDSVEIIFENGNITIVDGDNTVILTEQEYNELFNVQGFDSNGAPSMQGFNTRDADRVQFSGAEDVVFVMSNTEIHILAGKATSQYVIVSIDGYPVDFINTGVSKERLSQMRGGWTSIGGQVVDIPFEVYYEVTDEGQLIHKGAGYQNVWYDLEQRAQQIDNDGDLIN